MADVMHAVAEKRLKTSDFFRRIPGGFAGVASQVKLKGQVFVVVAPDEASLARVMGEALKFAPQNVRVELFKDVRILEGVQ